MEGKAISTLLLLQGGNPLPNWAVVALLLDHHAMDGFVRPTRLLGLRTPEQAEALRRLKQVLGRTHMVGQPGGPAWDEEPVADANDGEAVALAARKAPIDGADWVSYAGGTKVMSVHAPRGRPDATYSYLEAATHRLWVENKECVPAEGTVSKNFQTQVLPDAPAAIVQHDLRLYVQLDIESLFELHGAGLTPPDKWSPAARADAPGMADATDEMARLLASGAMARNGLWGEAWRTLLRTAFGPADDDKPRPCVPVNWLNGLTDLAGALATDLGLTDHERARFVDQGEIDAIPWDKKTSDVRRRTAARFLLAGWLERVVELWTREWLRERLEAAREATGIRPTMVAQGETMLRNIVVYPHIPAPQTGQLRPALKIAEIDVLALVGHQLLAISCTTGRDHLAEKAAEVWYRARQLGGSEARAVVVCLGDVNQVANVKAGLQTSYGGVARVSVIGRADLEDGKDVSGRQRFFEQLDRVVGWRR